MAYYSVQLHTVRNIVGGLAVGIPGQLKGMETAWKMHGRLPWADLIQPSINIARQGFNVSKSLSFAVEDNQQRLQSEKYMYNALRLEFYLLQQLIYHIIFIQLSETC